MIRLEIIAGASLGRSWAPAGDDITIGRSPECTVTLEDSHVSARHARIVQDLQAATLEDLGSTNGTALLRGRERFVVGDAGEALELRDGDIIELGHDDEVCR